MEHFKSPFESLDCEGERALDNRRFFDRALDRAERHRFFTHPFMSARTTLRDRPVSSPSS